MACLHSLPFAAYIESLDKAFLLPRGRDTETYWHPLNTMLFHSSEISPGMGYESCNFLMPIEATRKRREDSIGVDHEVNGLQTSRVK